MKTQRLFTILFLVMFLSACAPQAAPAVPAVSLSATPVKGTSTSVPTITPTVNPFAINLEKVNFFPESMQAVLDDPEKYQMAPDPLGNPPENGELAFESWFDALTHALGDPKLLPVNVLADNFTSDMGQGSCCGEFFASGVYPKPGEGTYSHKGYPTQKNPYFFYFSHNGVLHPVLGVKVGMNPNFGSSYWGVVFIILDQSGWAKQDDYGLDTIAEIYNGHHIYRGLFYRNEPASYPFTDPVTHALSRFPFNWKGFETWDTDITDRYAIGIGTFMIWNGVD